MHLEFSAVQFLHNLQRSRCSARCRFGRPRPRAKRPSGDFLYVAVPGVRDYLEYGGHGLLVFDIDDGHKFVKRIATAGVNETGRPLNVKGICDARTGRLYISTIKQLMCLDLAGEKVLWEKKYDAGCDRMSITPDGATIFLPSLEGPHWYVVDAEDGNFTRKIVTDSGRTTRFAARAESLPILPA